ncbi:MAG: NUDIX hydrolase [Pseudomonadota bacterium]
MTEPPIRDAATIVALRDMQGRRHVLMGQRGAQAAFMPSKFVFPGGAVDAADADTPLARHVAEPCATRLAGMAHALAVAAIRELWEETGLMLGQSGSAAGMPFLPDAAPLRFVFRAITPPGRPRRFDARFFAVAADALSSDLDDFSRASDELSHLRWVPLEEARSLDLPFITEVVLAELAALDPRVAPPSVPFFKNDDEESLFLRLRG